MIDLQEKEVHIISAGELICSESGLMYFKQDDRNALRVYAVLEGSDEDFDKLISQMQVRV